MSGTGEVASDRGAWVRLVLLVASLVLWRRIQKGTWRVFARRSRDRLAQPTQGSDKQRQRAA